MVFTAFPLLVRALFDTDIIVCDRPNIVRDENQPAVVNDFTYITRSKHPYVYDIGRLNMIFTKRNFVI